MSDYDYERLRSLLGDQYAETERLRFAVDEQTEAIREQTKAIELGFDHVVRAIYETCQSPGPPPDYRPGEPTPDLLGKGSMR